MEETLAEKANNLPMLPGVYLMQNAAGEIIYIGKAKKLKNRVSSYFHGKHLPKVAAMVEKVADFNVIVANSEFEALLLENSLIKRHKPHYNILLKDDKTYPFIRIDDRAEYPEFSIENHTAEDGARYFGPFGGRNTTREIIRTLCQTLKLPTCSRQFPRDLDKQRPCINYQMGTCSGWCRSSLSPEQYRAAISQAEWILEGKTEELLEELRRKMEDASQNMQFEQAATFRDRIRAIEELSNRQRVIATRFADTDAIGFHRGVKCCFTVLHYQNGDLAGKDFRIIPEPLEEDSEALSDLVRLYYRDRGAWPRTILLPAETEDRAEISRWLSELAGRKVYVEVPVKGERAGLVATANLNAKEECERRTSAEQRRSKTLENLQRMLDLPAFPHRIEAFDISNLGDTGIVAAMTVHQDGKPLKRDYRKFHIRDLELRNDYESMRQAVERRYRHYLDGDEKFSILPDLLLVDGGTGQAAAAEEVVRSLSLSIPVWGMVKDGRHRTRALVNSEGREIGLTGNPAVFALIGNIQEETHRSAISFQRQVRTGMLHSELDGIPGIGPKRRTQLLQHFRSVAAVRRAEIGELAEVLPSTAAEAVYEYFHEGAAPRRNEGENCT